MFGFGKRKQADSQGRPSTGGRLIYAVGDVHGRMDLLEELLGMIAVDAAATQPSEAPILVFLGDYVDRGPASRDVIDCLVRLTTLTNIEVRALKGNHEQAMMVFLVNPEFGPAWQQHGGAATLASYGVGAPPTRTPIEPWEEARLALIQAMPDTHLAFLQSLELFAEYGDYVFVHAGLRPGVPLARQVEQDLLWIREELIEERRPFEKVVVHGHTPEAEPVFNRVRVGLDTGAYATGVLTAARLYGTEQSVLQATAHGEPLAAAS